MSQAFSPGDFLVFQLESGFGLLRVLAVDTTQGPPVWHVAAYDDFFLDVDHAETAINASGLGKPGLPHVALTDRAFESTQVSKLSNVPLNEQDIEAYQLWSANPARVISDRSVRLMMGLR